MEETCSDMAQHCRLEAAKNRPSRTFLALARASVCSVEDSKKSLRILWTGFANHLTVPLLEKIAQAVAVDAAELPLLGLEETCNQHRDHSIASTELATKTGTICF